MNGIDVKNTGFDDHLSYLEAIYEVQLIELVRCTVCLSAVHLYTVWHMSVPTVNQLVDS